MRILGARQQMMRVDPLRQFEMLDPQQERKVLIRWLTILCQKD